jgi:DNA invertase Pin-like site-specific DNA recombinase
MLKAFKGQFDVVMAWSIDRLGRSLIDLLGTIQHLEGCRVDLYLDQQSIDTTTPTGRLMFQICGAFAEFERSMIRQRISAGLSRAKAQGKRLGRPKVPNTVERQVRRHLAKGAGILKVAKIARDWYGTADQAGNGSGCPGDSRRLKATADTKRSPLVWLYGQRI